MPSPPERERPAEAGRSQVISATTRQSKSHGQSTALLRLAVDADELVAEIERWLDAGDVTAMAALDGRCEMKDALEHVLTVNGKVRVLLGAAFVAVS